MALNFTGELTIILRVDNTGVGPAVNSTINQLNKVEQAQQKVARSAQAGAKSSVTAAQVVQQATAQSSTRRIQFEQAVHERMALLQARSRIDARVRAKAWLADIQAQSVLKRDALLRDYVAEQTAAERLLQLRKIASQRVANINADLLAFTNRAEKRVASDASNRAREEVEWRNAIANAHIRERRASVIASSGARTGFVSQWASGVGRGSEDLRTAAGAPTPGADTGTGFASVAGAFTTLFVAREVAGAIVSAIQPAVDMDEALARLRVTTGAAASELGGYQAAAVAAAAATRFSPTEAVEGMSALALAGIQGKDAFEAIMPVLDLAQARTLSVGMAAQTAGQLFKQFGLAGADLTLALDQLHEVSRLMNVSITNPLDTVSKLGSAATATSGSFSEMLIAFNLAARGMANQANAGTDLTALYTELADPGKRKAFGEAFQIPTDIEGRYRNTTDMIVDVAGKLIGATGRQVSATERQIAFAATDLGRVALKALRPMIGSLERGIKIDGVLYKGAAALVVLRKRAEEAGGALKTAAEIALNTFNGQLERMKENAGNVLMVLAKPTVSGLTGVFKVTGDIADAITRIGDANPRLAEAVKIVFKLTLAVISLGVAIAAVAASTQLLKVGLAYAMRELATTGIISFLRARLALLAFGSTTLGAVPAVLKLTARLGSAALAAGAFAVAFYYAKGIMQVIAGAFRSTEERARSFNVALLQEINERGYLNSFLEESFGLYRRLLGLDIVNAETARVRATKALEEAQKEYNGSLKDYMELLGRAMGMDWPPKVHGQNITNAARAMTRLGAAAGEAGVAFRNAQLANAPIEAILARGGTLNAKQGQQAIDLRFAMANALRQAGLNREASAMFKDVQALIQGRSAESIFNTDSVKRFGSATEAEQRAAADRMGISNLALLQANVQSATLNIANLTNPPASTTRPLPASKAQRISSAISMGEEATRAGRDVGTAAVVGAAAFGPVGALVAGGIEAVLSNFGAKMGRFTNAVERLGKRPIQNTVTVESHEPSFIPGRGRPAGGY